MSHLSNIEDILRTDDGLRAELLQRDQTFDVAIETDDAAEVFDRHDEAVGHPAGTGVVVAEEQRQGALNHRLLPGQTQLPVVHVY